MLAPRARELELSKSLVALRDAAPRPPGNIAHMLWTISCMRATGEAMPGFVRRSDFRIVLNRANISLYPPRTDEALQRALAAPLPPWMRRDAEGLLNSHQIATALAFLAYSQPELTRLFNTYSDGSGVMSLSRWLVFVRTEQHGSTEGTEDGGSAAVRAPTAQAAESVRLREAEADFVRILKPTGGELATDMGVELPHFVQLLLSPDNNAVGPTVEQDLSAPLSHYWGACSHNSYIIGDQLSGLSSADAYRRQLIQGCRHLEIDCWDGTKAPSVTHGFTFVTLETFAAVAQAIAETAFVTSELPVILSLEMHCSPPQQKQIAELLKRHLGSMLLTYDELCAFESPALLSPLELKRRVLVKGKVKGLIDAADWKDWKKGALRDARRSSSQIIESVSRRRASLTSGGQDAQGSGVVRFRWATVGLAVRATLDSTKQAGTIAAGGDGGAPLPTKAPTKKERRQQLTERQLASVSQRWSRTQGRPILGTTTVRTLDRQTTDRLPSVARASDDACLCANAHRSSRCARKPSQPSKRRGGAGGRCRSRPSERTSCSSCSASPSRSGARSRGSTRVRRRRRATVGLLPSPVRGTAVPRRDSPSTLRPRWPSYRGGRCDG